MGKLHVLCISFFFFFILFLISFSFFVLFLFWILLCTYRSRFALHDPRLQARQNGKKNNKKETTFYREMFYVFHWWMAKSEKICPLIPAQPTINCQFEFHLTLLKEHPVLAHYPPMMFYLEANRCCYDFIK